LVDSPQPHLVRPAHYSDAADPLNHPPLQETRQLITLNFLQRLKKAACALDKERNPHNRVNFNASDYQSARFKRQLQPRLLTQPKR